MKVMKVVDSASGLSGLLRVFYTAIFPELKVRDVSWNVIILREEDKLHSVEVKPSDGGDGYKLIFSMVAAADIYYLCKDDNIIKKTVDGSLLSVFREIRNELKMMAMPSVESNSNLIVKDESTGIEYIKLYYYMPIKYLLNVLGDGEIKVSIPCACNDPLEFLPSGCSANSEDEDFNYGFISFSAHGNNPLMWAHYADSHRGVCLEFMFPIKRCKTKYNNCGSRYVIIDLPGEYSSQGFEISPEHGSIAVLVEVSYDRVRPPYSPQRWEVFGRGGEILKFELHKVYYTKSIEWKYEAEWRLMVPLSRAGRFDKENGFFVKGLTPYITKVLLGAKCEYNRGVLYASARHVIKSNDLYKNCKNAYGNIESNDCCKFCFERVCFDDNEYKMILVSDSKRKFFKQDRG